MPWYANPGTARDFTYVDDAVAGILAALRHGRSGEAYNLSGWRSVELRAALELLEDAACSGVPACAGAEAHVTRAAAARPRAELGYAPRVDLATGIERQLAAASPAALAA